MGGYDSLLVFNWVRKKHETENKLTFCLWAIFVGSQSAFADEYDECLVSEEIHEDTIKFGTGAVAGAALATGAVGVTAVATTATGATALGTAAIVSNPIGWIVGGVAVLGAGASYLLFKDDPEDICNEAVYGQDE